MSSAHQRKSDGVERRYRYLLEQAHTQRDGYGRRWFPAPGICIFDHKPGYVAADRNTVLNALSLIEDWTPCGELDGYGRSASQKG